jgi:hypothetical protein
MKRFAKKKSYETVGDKDEELTSRFARQKC